jgi:hypothetical protein
LPDADLSLLLQTLRDAGALASSMRKAGFEPQWAPVTDWAGMVNADIARMKAVADKAQIKLE